MTTAMENKYNKGQAKILTDYAMPLAFIHKKSLLSFLGGTVLHRKIPQSLKGPLLDVFVSGNCFDNPRDAVPWESNTQCLFCFSNVGDL